MNVNEFQLQLFREMKKQCPKAIVRQGPTADESEAFFEQNPNATREQVIAFLHSFPEIDLSDEA